MDKLWLIPVDCPPGQTREVRFAGIQRASRFLARLQTREHLTGPMLVPRICRHAKIVSRLTIILVSRTASKNLCISRHGPIVAQGSEADQ